MSSKREREIFSISSSYLTNDFKEMKYSASKKHQTGTKHGQRKLAFALLQFVTLYCIPKYLKKEMKKTRYVVVYAGAAHGDNIAFISKLRPDIEFHLYDPAHFTISEVEDKINIYNPHFPRGGVDVSNSDEMAGFFTNSQAKKWKKINKRNGNVFFVSDIRSVIKNDEDDYAQELNIFNNDMQMQKEWVRIINPVKAQLKFRLPFPKIEGIPRSEKYVSYLPGKLYFSFWSGNSTEMRLVPSSYTEDVYYNIKKFEKQLTYYNTVERYSISWKTKNPGPEGGYFTGIDGTALNDDRDSISEIFIWVIYLNSVGSNKYVTKENIKNLAASLSQALGRKKLIEIKKETAERFSPL